MKLLRENHPGKISPKRPFLKRLSNLQNLRPRRIQTRRTCSTWRSQSGQGQWIQRRKRSCCKGQNQKNQSPRVPKAEPKPDQPAPQMSSAQKSAIFNLSRRRGISVEELGKMSQENYGVPLENLTAANASTFIRTLQQSA